MEHNVKRIQAPMTNLRPEMLKAKTPTSTPQKPIVQAKQTPTKVVHKHAKVEICEKHKSYKVAYEPQSGQQMCNLCLFELQAVKSEETKEPQHLFTALITRDLKRKFDREYKIYKDSLCEVAEVDPDNVKSHMVSQVQEFFAAVRNQVKVVRQEVTGRVKGSKALQDLETLIAQNGEYFGANAGVDLAKEKDQFDQKLARGRFATVVKRQEYYGNLIKIVDEANDHMQ